LPKASDSGKQAILEISGGSERKHGVVMPLGAPRAVGAPGATDFGTGTESLVNDGLDGARATAAFGAAAEAAIDLLGTSRKVFRGTDSAADVVIC